ncbi:TetR/AcrR family transcriptional regulator [Desulfosporosinus sp.]|uniref:TetR/AcrR family transcriptional regulator n=1 Tax=Desulfosporosinus sp. TaxID=157907 RepID=UPI0023088142|nr:TetR/AcrR family transcriptional regulator [Desulfosporosinus sp.]MCO5388245.1 TetR/AcrR family transcriptional regulator [Desulfosporosinus sp.]MDA8220410.1 TetR/AcrR family transcriptional regulator [Desulfitobacterium hafniense]
MARQKDKEETILNAAFEVFSENGFTNASMKDIAAKAGLGKGTLYEYFQNKEDLFIQVVKSKTGHFFNEINRRISDKMTLREILNEIIMFTQETLAETEFFFKFMVFGEFFEMSCEVKQKLYEMILSNREESVNVLRKHFEKGSADGILREFDWKFAANFIPEMIGTYCNFKMHIMGDCWSQDQKDLDREKMIDFILNGVGAKTK